MTRDEILLMIQYWANETKLRSGFAKQTGSPMAPFREAVDKLKNWIIALEDIEGAEGSTESNGTNFRHRMEQMAKKRQELQGGANEQQ